MENKYYTPEIEEFCVDLEYETNNINHRPQELIKNNWKIPKKGINWLQCFYGSSHLSDVDLQKVRVKILDEQDILDCGFIYDSTDYLGNVYYVYRSFILTFYPPTPTFIEIDNSEAKFTRFIGEIKNNCELKKLLKQLGFKL